MKVLKMLMLFFALGLTSVAFTACGGETTAEEKQGKEYTSAYVCPMHCEGSGSEEAGKCPVCGMDYVANENHKMDEHSHDDHEGHDH